MRSRGAAVVFVLVAVVSFGRLFGDARVGAQTTPGKRTGPTLVMLARVEGAVTPSTPPTYRVQVGPTVQSMSIALSGPYGVRSQWQLGAEALRSGTFSLGVGTLPSGTYSGGSVSVSDGVSTTYYDSSYPGADGRPAGCFERPVGRAFSSQQLGFSLVSAIVTQGPMVSGIVRKSPAVLSPGASVSLGFAIPVSRGLTQFQAVFATSRGSGFYVMTSDVAANMVSGTATQAVSPSPVDGAYLLQSITVADDNAYVIYYRNGSVTVNPSNAIYAPLPLDFSTIDFMMVHPGQDRNAPVLNSINGLGPTSVAPGGVFNVAFSVSEDVGIIRANLSFRSPHTGFEYTLTASEIASGQAAVRVPANAVGGRYRLQLVGLNDIDNYAGYYAGSARVYDQSGDHIVAHNVALGAVVFDVVKPSTLRFTAISPVRALDTRNGIGGYTTPWVDGFQCSVQVTSIGSIPSVGVKAVLLNVTALNQTAGSFLRVGTSSYNVTSNLNWVGSKIVPNAVVSDVSTAGTIDIYNNNGAVDIVIDVMGYFEDPGTTVPQGRLVGLTPARILDTRDASSPFTSPWGPRETRVLSVRGRGGVPNDAVAVMLNVTVTDPTAASYLTVWPGGSPPPNASNLNWDVGDTVANLVVAKLSTSGDISLYNAAGTVAVIADVVGYVTDSGSGANALASYPPIRVVDTRSNLGISGTLTTGSIGSMDLGPACSPTAKSAVINVTVTNTTADSYLTLWPSGSSKPTASSLNWKPGTTVANLAVVKLGPDGRIAVFNNRGSTDLIVDLVGCLD